MLSFLSSCKVSNPHTLLLTCTTPSCYPPHTAYGLTQSIIIAILIYIIVANMAAIHAKRVTIQKKDMEFIHNICQMMTGFKFPSEK